MAHSIFEKIQNSNTKQNRRPTFYTNDYFDF